jgi:hypothetical protein
MLLVGQSYLESVRGQLLDEPTLSQARSIIGIFKLLAFCILLEAASHLMYLGMATAAERIVVVILKPLADAIKETQHTRSHRGFGG